MPGTLTVTKAGVCLTGAVSRLTVGAGESICLGAGTKLNGGQTIAVHATGDTVTGKSTIQS